MTARGGSGQAGGQSGPTKGAESWVGTFMARRGRKFTDDQVESCCLGKVGPVPVAVFQAGQYSFSVSLVPVSGRTEPQGVAEVEQGPTAVI